MMVICVHDRIAAQIVELRHNTGDSEEDIVLTAVQQAYIRMLDFKKAEAVAALDEAFLRGHELPRNLDDDIPF